MSVMAPADSQNHFSAVKSLGIFLVREGFHSPQTQNSAQSVFGKPVLLGLGLKNVENVLDLPAADRLVKVDKKVGLSQVAIVFRDFVLQNVFPPVRIPGEIGNQTMVLVPVVAIVGQDDVGEACFLMLSKYSLISAPW